MNKKIILRREYKQIRSKTERKGEKSQKIRFNLKSVDEYKKARIVALYASLEDEVDTSPIVNDALESGKTVLLPIIDSGGEMDFYETGDAFKVNTLGIKEPQGTKKHLPEEIDLIIVPLICADENRNRIGFGGGYYDRYLSKFKGNTIGVCFDEQISTEPLPCSEYDIKPDIILSDKRIIR